MTQPQKRGIWTRSMTYTTAQGNAKSPTHWVRPRIKPTSLWILVRFITLWAKIGTPFFFKKIFIYLFIYFHSCICGIWKFLARSQVRPAAEAYATATAISDPSRICNYATACGNNESLTHWERPEIEPTSSRTLCQVLNPLSHNENPLKIFLNTIETI